MAKVLIHSPGYIGESMAGPVIRALEFAKALASYHEVILLAPGDAQCQTDGFKRLSLEDPNYPIQFRDADVLVTQRLSIPLAKLASHNGVKVIIDAYDPSPLELLEYYKRDPKARRREKIAAETSTLAFNFKMADGILCASERQRDLWIGFLMALKLISPAVYDRDSSLRGFIDVVPFGLPSLSPKKNGMGLKQKLGLHPEDKVLLWGGGIWNWFDPLSLIKAMKIISLTRADIKLVFMGVKPPAPAPPAMWMARDAMQLAQQLELLGRTVFFHQEWVPYDQRQNFLLDADVGVSTHFEHLETHFSFRTRILDYLWAQLPIIATKGDSFAELIDHERLGLLVPYQDEEALAESIIKLLDDQDQLLQIKQNISRVCEKFCWTSVISPLHHMIEELASRSQTCPQWKARIALFTFLMNRVRDKILDRLL